MSNFARNIDRAITKPKRMAARAGAIRRLKIARMVKFQLRAGTPTHKIERGEPLAVATTPSPDESKTP